MLNESKQFKCIRKIQRAQSTKKMRKKRWKDRIENEEEEPNKMENIFIHAISMELLERWHNE